MFIKAKLNNFVVTDQLDQSAFVYELPSLMGARISVNLFFSVSSRHRRRSAFSYGRHHDHSNPMKNHSILEIASFQITGTLHRMISFIT
ncbi:hypothetical protein [Domibacillus antri]|uniref:hypothetical protein n=1 Tax=Domibacillus antri TaxID=1714264 RepID=UPI001178898B|nr:hypothetical protein [Domibacillus antri]